LYRFIEDKVLPGTGIKSADFWKGFDEIVKDLSPKNEALLAKRDRLQADLDQWHKANPGPIKDMPAYRKYLKEIGYIDEAPDTVLVTTQNVDDELALQAGPQLVVPVLNARYALNAANARWGSLYDALYGTDVISIEGGADKDGPYNPIRGAKVVAYARQFLDESAPLAKALYGDVVAYSVVDKKLSVKLKDGSNTGLVDEKQFVGYQGDGTHLELKSFLRSGSAQSRLQDPRP
jgi:malate synthase